MSVFQDFELGPSLQRAIAGAGFTQAWPVQVQTIPAILAGRDVLGLAQTGTGKTAAFALPILERFDSRSGPGPRALILAPTRELATQIHAEMTLLAKFTRVKCITVFGGVAAAPQRRALSARPDVIIACPGRLLDLLGQGAVFLGKIEILVLDEADHMFDLGFLPSIRRVLAALPKRRQNLMFSATMPGEIRKLADAVLQEPVVVELQASKPPATIDHALYSVPQDRKIGLLKHLLSNEGSTPAIVFSRTKQRAKRVADQLSRAGLSAVALQGNMSQPQRERAMSGFREGRFDVLVATDIAARGIDVAGVAHVINFDIPNTPDAYTHRIGRTGRAERSGKAYTFVSSEDQAALRAIERRLGSPIARRSLPSFAHEVATPVRSASRPQFARPAAGATNHHARRRSDAPSVRAGRARPSRRYDR